MMNVMKKILLPAVLFFSLIFSAVAHDFFFDDIVTVSSSGYDLCYPEGISSEKNGENAVYFYQEVLSSKKQIYLSAESTKDGLKWKSNQRFAGPFSYEGDVPQIYSVAKNKDGASAVAVLSSEDSVTVFVSSDGFENIIETKISTESMHCVAPRIFLDSSGGYVMFVSVYTEAGEDYNYFLEYARSRDGINWSGFKRFDSSSQSSFNPVVPYLVPVGNSKDMLVYQSQYSGSDHLSIQLYSSISSDNCLTWSTPKLISGADAVSGAMFYDYNNQGACVKKFSDGKIYIAWERSPFYSSNADICFAELNDDGSLKNSAERLSFTGFSSGVKIFESRGSANVFWFTTVKNSEKVYLAQKIGGWWNEAEVISTGSSMMPSYLLTNGGKEIAFVWEEKNPKSKFKTLGFMNTDHSVAPPKLNSVNFKNFERNNRKNLRVKISPSYDSSGIKGFSWIWTQDKYKNPLSAISMDGTETVINCDADRDGTWFFKAVEQDYAGNWSDAEYLHYDLDTTPPKELLLSDLEVDSTGCLPSNTFSVNWTPDETDDDIAGYTYSVKIIESIPKRIAYNKRHPLKITEEQVKSVVDEIFENNKSVLEKSQTVPSNIVTKKTSIDFHNMRNGLYVLSVAAIDKVGNIGKSVSKFFVTNKYIPFTLITSVDSMTDNYGETTMSIIGDGFLYDGRVTKIYLDQDGLAPYDIELSLANNDYKIPSNNRISDIHLKYAEAGDYKVGLIHSDRGLYFTKNVSVSIPETGTVKLKGTYVFEPVWNILVSAYKKSFNITTPVFIALLVIGLAGFVLSSAGLMDTAKQSIEIKAEVKALLEGDIMPNEKKKKSTVFKNKGISLKAKLVLHSSILIASMDILIFLFFGFYMIRTQKKTLTSSLANRVSVMMDSVASGAKVYLPQTTPSDNLSLTDIVNQTTALNESMWATVTGFPYDESTTTMNSVWATTDKSIILNSSDSGFIPGTTLLPYENMEDVISQCAELNAKAESEAGIIAQNISELTREGIMLSDKTDEESVERRAEIQTIRLQLTQKLETILNRIAEEGEGCVPEFTEENITSDNTEFTFYKPVLYRQGASSNYVHGVVLVKISTKTLLEQIANEKQIIINTCSVIIVLALILAVISTYIMASVIVRPINRLVSHVAMIRDTDDKESLSGKDIIVKSKDEIGMLGETVNEMTRGLVEAAVQAKNLTLGKDIQTKFIPLDEKNGVTLSTGTLRAKGADFFSFYAGADDLSGDYFDYKQLDETHYAIIKCDVSGHGVPAALIMVEVATLFLNSFRNWSMKNPRQGINMAPVVGQINDLLESRGFKGRFAAFTLCIMDTATGECWFCNAGDNLVHIYDSQTRTKKVIKLQETPAAGMFSTDLIDMKGGYKVSKVTLKKDDVLILFTDGIEEAKRLFRDENLQVIKCQEPGIPEGEMHAMHTVGDDNEEMSPERVTEIIEAVYGRKRFTLHKYHSQSDQSDFEFDFSTCEGTAEEVIMALVSVEKIFRMYKAPVQQQNHRVKTDVKIDSFLREHFVQYSEWCAYHTDIEGSSTHIYYNGVLEDPQYDDLTLIAIKKN